MANDNPKGRILSVYHRPDGTTHVALDNGATMVINLLMNTYQFPAFDGEDEYEIYDVLANPTPGSRNKRTSDSKGVGT